MYANKKILLISDYYQLFTNIIIWKMPTSLHSLCNKQIGASFQIFL